MSIDYHNIITIEAGKRSDKPCIRGLRITVYDVLSWLANGMSRTEIVVDFPEITDDDITACLQFAADRERQSVTLKTLIDNQQAIQQALIFDNKVCIEIV